MLPDRALSLKKKYIPSRKKSAIRKDPSKFKRKRRHDPVRRKGGE